MAEPEQLDAAEIQRLVDQWLEVEFTFLNTDALCRALAALPEKNRRFVLTWIERTASTNVELAFQFARQSERVLALMDEHTIEAWLQYAMDQYDRSGLRPAIEVINQVEDFVRLSFERASGSVFEEQVRVLTPFVHGLSGRRLKLEAAELSYTDSETLFLPTVVAALPSEKENFMLHKAMAVHLWSQTRFGTFREDIFSSIASLDDREHALSLFHILETHRLDACIARELPGLHREMQQLRRSLGERCYADVFYEPVRRLESPHSTVEDTLTLMEQLYGRQLPAKVCYQGQMDLEAVRISMAARKEREKAIIRVKLAELADELVEKRQVPEPPEKFELEPKEDSAALTEAFEFDLVVEDQALNVPESLRQVITSVILDFGEIPDEYLVPAGDGEYDLSSFDEEKLDPDDVWKGTYHEEGATLHHEWDFARQCYRKNWCVLRELDVPPVYDDFYTQTMNKHARLIKSLHRTFEALRGEDKLLKKQSYGEDVDIDALVEAWADMQSGMEMTDRLFTRMHKEERNIAVMFMVDMSGSTQGWINDAERESLILLSESLEILDDRYAIYGFSGTTRKRCELYRIKSFEDDYDDMVRARISGIQAQDYTRMGVAIRHLSAELNKVEARIKLLVTLSDGKPEDYDGYYRSEYGIEDTRMALFEARRDGVHPFCITIDTDGPDYLPHMYGAANYVVIDDVAKLPLKVSDIYRQLTS